MTILLTGANGFLGGHIARELLGRGYGVRALVRPGSDRTNLAGLPIEMIEGTICQPDDVLRATQGCGGVIHAAALARVNPARNPQIWAVNKTGTDHVIRAVQQTGVGRLVYVGTANVFGFGSKENPGNETRPYAGRPYGIDYMDSKAAATERVRQAAQQDNLPAVLVHPTFLVGPLDTKPTSGALLLAVATRQLPGYPAGGKNYVHVRDAAIATVNALTMGRLGESYILGHENLTYREAFTHMATAAGVQPPRLALPPGFSQLYGRFNDAWATLTGRPPTVTLAMARVASDGHYFSSEKAIWELRLPQTPIHDAFREACDWFADNGYL